MNWEAAGAIGEIVGALAVVVTLGYLAMQVRSAREAAADTNRLNRANNVMDIALALATHPDLARNLANAEGITPYSESYAEMFDLDAEQAGSVDWVHCHTFWMHWGQYSSSTSPGDLDEIANVAASIQRSTRSGIQPGHDMRASAHPNSLWADGSAAVARWASGTVRRTWGASSGSGSAATRPESMIERVEITQIPESASRRTCSSDGALSMKPACTKA